MSRMEELIDIIEELNYYYYTLDKPKVSDVEYDRLYDELVALEKELNLVDPMSPTQRVGGSILDKFQKHVHLSPLYSLDKSQNFGSLEDWVRRCERTIQGQENASGEALPPLEYIVEYKFDGLTINLTYDQGRLQMATTRGNGIVGEEILEQVLTILSIPTRIPYKGKIEVQGEGLMPLSALAKYNETAEVPLKNARNAAAGALRNLNTRETARRNLTAFFYNVGYWEEELFTTQEEMIDFLKQNHFKVSGLEEKVKTFSEMKAAIERIESNRHTFDFLTDGAVIKINNLKVRELLGYTIKFPRWAMAYKFEAEEITTILREVEWNVGRTGKITPTAILDPVDIGGVTVSRATLNNYDDILRKGVRLGSRVLIRRSNDVIPEILGVIEEEGTVTEVIRLPSHCPYCHSTLEQDGVHTFCLNSLSCKPQLVARLTHFASRDAMDIVGFSEKTIEKLMDALNLVSLSQIYDLEAEDFAGMEGFKEKRITNLLKAIEDSKETTLPAFLYAIGIPGVGIKTSKDLASHYKTLDNIKNATMEELVTIPDVGDKTAEAIREFFHDDHIRESLDRLLSKGIRFEEEASSSQGSSLEGKRIVVTGSIEGYTRSELEKRLEELGAKTSSSVSKNTDFVIAGENAGSKYEKALALSVPIIPGDEVEDFIQKNLL